MRMQDFLGHEYGEGDLVIYAAMSGRCVNMIFGRCVEVYEVYRSPDTYDNVKLADGEPAPFQQKYGYFDSQGNLVENWNDRSELEWRSYETTERIETYIRVKVQPLRGARWTQHSNKTYYVDTRNGKRINRDAPSGKHVLKYDHYVHADGTEYDYEGEKERWEAEISRRRPSMYRDRGEFDYHFRRMYRVIHGPVGNVSGYSSSVDAGKRNLWWVPTTYQPWVEERTEGPKPVTLEVTDNIVKWEGDLPEES
jgi:hypothetical protein